VITVVLYATIRTRRPPMMKITRPTVQLSLLVTPQSDAARDDFSLAERNEHLGEALARVRELALLWPTTRSDELFEDFEAQLRELLFEVGRSGSELMLGVAEAKDRRERPRKYSIGETTYRMSAPEPRSFNTWFGVIRYRRSYARPVGGGVGHCPLDFELGLLGDRISPNLLATGARLATRMSFSEAREVLGWFVPQPPSTEVLEQTVLGFGHHTAAWFRHAPPPEDDGEVLVIMLDGKCVPTARESELRKRRGKRSERAPAPSARHRGRDMRKMRGRAPRRKKGDKSKNGKQVMMVVMYTLKREGKLLLGPLNRQVYASFGKKRHAFEYALEEAERRGFGKGTDKTVQILTDGDPDLHLYTDEYFTAEDYPNRVVTVDVVHVLEKLWDAGRARHREGSEALAAWVRVQENRLYGDKATLVLDELRVWLAETPKTGPGNKGRRKRLSNAIRYLDRRLDKVNYGTYRAQDLEVGTGQVEGAIKYVIAKRCDHGGMRWIRQRAQAVIQLRCIDVNRHWHEFVRWALTRLRTTALANGSRARLQTNIPAKLPHVAHAA
jgi:hypothetical protein